MDTVKTESETLREFGARRGLIRAYKEHEDLLILALTGRTGSGCTTAADLLTESYQKQLAAQYNPSGPEARKYVITMSFAENRWESFSKITVSALLVTFLVECTKVNLRKANQAFAPDHRLDNEKFEALWKVIRRIRPEFRTVINILKMDSQGLENINWNDNVAIKTTITQILPQKLKEVRSILGTNYSSFLQSIGDNIRRSGHAWDSKINEKNLFRLPKRITRAIECIREIDKVTKVKTRIVIDAIRNPLELIYLRDRYSPLYALAITAPEDHRKSRLVDNGFNVDEIATIDNREYPDKHDPYQSYKALVTQDIQSCLQKADIFISNPGKSNVSKSSKRQATGHLYAQLIRYYALALHPGLVTPTRDERCMQIAFTAKANSGCISRQVGAAVTDQHYAVKAIGWNDVPKGQVPCALRNVDQLLTANDKVTYSIFERENDVFRRHVSDNYSNRSILQEDGLPCSYCFKDAVNSSVFAKNGKKGSNQVHTRSLHAEENAFLLLANSAPVKGGKLFTTASPCELCSKKAFQMGVRDVIYIDPYPGISESHVMGNGTVDMRPVPRLFNGAVGKAYHRLYEPLIPIKDELMARMKS